MNKLKLHTPNITETNISKLEELFPHCVTEGKIDFELLKQELSNSIIDGTQERYQLNWVGKREALLTANAPIAKTLRPNREESVNFDSTENLYIEGDNLDALKLLQETYLNKVKMIYIDPPYNTGNDFIYEDDFAENITDYLQRSNQKDEDGNRLVANTESNGRFHSDWLSMMYPRLKLARNLLKDDGVIFISINDCELHNLSKICNEVFGEDNFIETFIWIKKVNPPNNVIIGSVHEYILAFAKNKLGCDLSLLPRNTDSDTKYKNPDNDPRGRWVSGDLTAAAKGGRMTPSLMYSFENPFTGESHEPPPGRMWIVPKNRMLDNITDNRIYWGSDNNGKPKYKRFLSEVRDGVSCSTLLNDVGNNGDASKEVNAIFDGDVVFDTPKPTTLIKRLIQISIKQNQVVLDFFSGSATTAHAVMQLNAEDGGNRKFIMVQIPEACDEKSEAFKAGYKTIADIGKERIRRAGQKIKTDNALTATDLDIGFRVLKVDSSNMNEVFYTPDQTKQQGILNLVDNIRTDRSDEDLLFQVLLDWGVDLTLPIVEKTIDGKTVFVVADNEIVACFDRQGGITEDFIKELAKLKSLRVVFCDKGFADDSGKINVEPIFKSLSPHTQLKAI
jgi:adenine-specific DNA-methyltransferase